MTEQVVALCTVPAREVGLSIGTRLIEAGVAACVNVLPGVSSIFSWQGSICTEEECLLVIKTRHDAYPRMQALIESLHPYDVPEIIALDISQGNEKYLAWIDSLVLR